MARFRWCSSLALGVLLLGGVFALAQGPSPSDSSAGGPADPPWRTVVIPPGEPGETLIVSGRIVGSDGETPVSGARLYVYQTDATGVYSAVGARRPRLRGWMKTGPDGRYEFRTIRPGSYPGTRIAAHIHAKLAAPGQPEQGIEEYRFANDPYLPASAPQAPGLFSHVLTLERGTDGVWRGRRDIRIDR